MGLDHKDRVSGELRVKEKQEHFSDVVLVVSEVCCHHREPKIPGSSLILINDRNVKFIGTGLKQKECEV